MTNNKDYLSQEEIDALLRQSSDDSFDDGADIKVNVNDYLSPIEQDALGEIGNITFGSAATALSTLLGKKVDITTPKVSIISKPELQGEFPKPHVAVHVKYVDGFQGINLLVIKTQDAQVIADLMLGGDGTVLPEELNEIHISAVQEAMNQMMGSSATSMSTIFNRFVNISPPGIDIMDLSKGDGSGNLPPVDVFIKISFRLIIGDLIDSNIMQLVPVQFAKEMVSILMGAETEPLESEPQSAPAAAAATAAPVQPQPEYQAPYTPPVQQQIPPQQMQQPAAFDGGYGAYPPQQQGQAMPPAPHGYGAMPPQRNVNVQPVNFGALNPTGGYGQEENNLNLLMDIPLKVTVELGRTQKQIRDILELSQGSIIELDKLAGEPVDILVNNKLIAKGEVVVIDENFGVRVTDIVSQWDRIQKIK